MPPDEAKTVTRHESFGVLRSDWKLIARIEEGLCKALRRRGANDVATPSSAMSTSASSTFTPPSTPIWSFCSAGSRPTP